MGTLADGIDSAMDQCPSDNGGNRNGMRETTNRSPMSKKNAPALSIWAPGMNIDGHSFTDIRGHRRLRPASAFASNSKQAIVPVDIIQIQGYDFAGPQT